MTALEPVSALVRYHAAIDRLDFAAIESLFSVQARYVSAGIGCLEGRDAIMAAFRRYFAEYRDQVAVDDCVEAVGTSSARARWHLLATSSETGEALKRQGEETVTFDGEGRILMVEVVDFGTSGDAAGAAPRTA